MYPFPRPGAQTVELIEICFVVTWQLMVGVTTKPNRHNQHGIGNSILIHRNSVGKAAQAGNLKLNL